MRKIISNLKEVLKRSKIIVKIYILGYRWRSILVALLYKAYIGVVFMLPFLHSKDYYLVFRNEKNAGICSHLIVYLQMFSAAEKLNMKPIVDMKNYENPYVDMRKRENAWNYFFNDCVAGFNIDTILKSELFVFNKSGGKQFLDDKILKYDKDEVGYWSRLYTKYVHYNNRVQEEIEKEYEKYFKNVHDNGKKILGVKLRGTDYNGIKPEGHYIQPTAEEMIVEAERILDEEKIDYLYLATEDEEIAEDFYNYFGNRLIMREGLLTNKEIAGMIPVAQAVAKQFGRIESGINYIKDIDLLSKTDYLLTSGNSGAVLAIIMNNLKYKKVWLKFKGFY